jgi:Purple acid Phosphatase, N-terminal domain
VTTKFTRSYKSDHCTEEAPAPCHTYLTIPRDPNHEMIVNFHTRYSLLDEAGVPTVLFDTQSHANTTSTTGTTGVDLDAYRFRASGYAYRFEALKERKRWLNWVDLVGLTPNTVYYFVAGAGNQSARYSAERSFRTFPTQQPYAFGVGGDVSVNQYAAAVLDEMTREDELLMIAIGGDIAYAQGLPWCYCRWDDYFVMWDLVRTPQGHVVPIACVAGRLLVVAGVW